MKDFEEGWQAASNRVRASLENIFNKLIDDDFFVDFLNGLSEALERKATEDGKLEITDKK
mgnify:CR=1 FL=1